MSKRVRFKYWKVYDPKGKYILHLSSNETEKVREFTGKDPSEFRLVDCPIFGLGYEIPCSLKEKVIKKE